MNLQHMITTLDAIAPPELAEPWDNTGLLLHPLRPRPVRRILLTIDLTEAVADEAIAKKTDLVVAYHPILFRAVNRLDAARAHDRMVMKLVQSNTAVYSPHTALDAVLGGVNDWLADGLGDGDVSILRPIAGTTAGQGRLVVLRRPVPFKTLSQRIKKHLGVKTLRTACPADARPIGSIALCAGAGAEVFKGIAADCFLTGEMGHHHVMAATSSGAHVVLCEHTHTERGYLPVFRRILHNALGNTIDIAISEMDSEPILTT